MTVVTNVVAALAITTTRLVPVPCPDGIEGCCVLHTDFVSDTRYEPVKVSEKDCDNPCTSRGIALSTNALYDAIASVYWNRKLPQLIPIRALKGDGGINVAFPVGDGFVWKSVHQIDADVADACRAQEAYGFAHL